MRLYSKRNIPRVKTCINDYKKVEIIILGTLDEIHSLQLFCEESGIPFKIKTLFIGEIRIACTVHQYTHLSLMFL